MTPEEFAAKWERTTSTGWTIATPFIAGDKGIWVALLKNHDDVFAHAAWYADGQPFPFMLSCYGNLVPRKVTRWVTRGELKEGMRIVRTGFKPVGGLVVMEPCIRWNDGSLANVASYGSRDTFLIEEPA